MTLWLLLILLFLLPLGNIIRIPLYDYPSVFVTPADGVVILISLICAVQLFKTTFKLPPGSFHAGLFFCIGIISLFIAGPFFSLQELIISSMYLFRLAAYYCIYIATFNEGKKYHAILITALFISGFINSLLGLLQYFLYPNLRNLSYLGWDPHELRIFGTFLDSGYMALMIVLTMLLAIHLLLISTNKQRLLYGAAVIVTNLSLLLTYARSGYLSSIAGITLISWYKKNGAIIVATIILLLAGLLVLPKNTGTSEATRLTRTASTNSRIQNYQQTLQLFLERPVLGWGFNSLRYVRKNRNMAPEYESDTNHAASGSDSSLLFILATTGTIGMLSYLLLLKSILIPFLNKKPMIQSLVYSSCVAVGVHGFFLNTYFYPWVLVWLYILIGSMHSTNNLRLITRRIS